MFSESAACAGGRMDSYTDFLERERFANLDRWLRARRKPKGVFPMDFVGPLVSRLGVVTAYVAIAFVGAIVLGVF
ncbi:hypothetical protein [Bradyrhizobium sp.]|uniref:hypothetical protein n=1 Tax=Bradyrhizobium sp. TaxID=376 RepID=UPI002CB66C64|nr:hypothetical protein [Bradyrhizobium sp.]HMM90518.1 hypothetical protein [Bradyrhizobium sp.]